MVRFMRSAIVSLGMMPLAVEFAKNISQYMSEKYGQQVEVYMESSGILYWISDYPDYETYGRVRTGIANDMEYWQMIEDAAECFVDGSIEDVLLTKIQA